jgi:hypothetical protein
VQPSDPPFRPSPHVTILRGDLLFRPSKSRVATFFGTTSVSFFFDHQCRHVQEVRSKKLRF